MPALRTRTTRTRINHLSNLSERIRVTMPAATAAPKKTAEKTTYVVLRAEPKSRDYTFLQNVQARSANEAVRQAILKTDGAAIGNSEGQFSYVAIPARSFKPVTVKVETKTTIKLG